MAKYRPFPRIELPDRTWPEREITAPPEWCSVDLRDGNQALAIPMGIEQKLEMFQLLVDIGFKEIEVGFPSASQIEFDFLRRLIDEDRIPDGVYVQVLTQAREHLIRRTFESIKGAKNAVIHMYNSTSVLQRRVTFNMSKEQILDIAVKGTKLVRELANATPETTIRFEYSPESFSDTEVDYALQVCEAVADAWGPTRENPMVMNLPDTVEWATPNVYADQIEWFARHLRNRETAVISLHTHNDRGTGVAKTELGLMAGADRVEGTLFGNGERTGNLDIVTVALNMFAHGIDPGLDFTNIPYLRERYEALTGMTVHPRHPYAGELVFTAFSGSHQDAIKKGMDLRAGHTDAETPWAVPYLTIDPSDIGRNYQAIIRINSQSGKGGVAYILSREYGLDLPKAMHPEFGKIVNDVADRFGGELSAQDVRNLFDETYLRREEPLKILDYTTETREAPAGDQEHHETELQATVELEGARVRIVGRGSGPIDALVHGMAEKDLHAFEVTDFKEQAVGSGSETDAVAYIQVRNAEDTIVWGAGMDSDISMAGLKAVACAYNRLWGGKQGDAAAGELAAERAEKPVARR